MTFWPGRPHLHWVRMGLLAVVVLITAVSSVPQAARAQTADRGYLTSVSDLEAIGLEARWGVEPYAHLVADFIESTDSPDEWEHGDVAEVLNVVDGDCASDSAPEGDRFVHQQGGAQEAFRKMIAYHLTHDVEYARVAREKILELTTTTNYGGSVYDGSNECILHLARALPLWIQAADLLSTEPVWTHEDRAQFSQWLVEVAYPKVAWASRVRRNNWGTAGSLSASMIADYVTGQEFRLTEIEPEQRDLTPEQAFQEHNEMQLRRMNTEWEGDSRCDIWGIQPTGAIPDELRRGATGCTGDFLADNDDSYDYQVAQIDDLVFHAEYLRRRGNTGLFDNIAPDCSGSLLRAILFVIANPINPDQSYRWPGYKLGVLNVANRYYHNPAVEEALAADSLERGATVSFGQLTHPDLPAADANGAPPVQSSTEVQSTCG